MSKPIFGLDDAVKFAREKLTGNMPISTGLVIEIGAEIQRLTDENNAMKMDLDSAIWPFMENGKLECSLIPPSCRTKDKGSDEG